MPDRLVSSCTGPSWRDRASGAGELNRCARGSRRSGIRSRGDLGSSGAIAAGARPRATRNRRTPLLQPRRRSCRDIVANTHAFSPSEASLASALTRTTSCTAAILNLAAHLDGSFTRRVPLVNGNDTGAVEISVRDTDRSLRVKPRAREALCLTDAQGVHSTIPQFPYAPIGTMSIA